MLLKILLVVLVVIVIIVIMGLLKITSMFYNQTVLRKICTKEDLIKEQIERGLIDEKAYEKLEKENFEVETFDKLKLKGVIIDNKSDKTIILVHGITVSLEWSIKYINMFLKRKWNVVIYDQRRHGDSEGTYSTYGFYEKQDVDVLVNYCIKRWGQNSIIGLHGESMGAATVLQYASINKYVKFIIADCSFSNLIKEFKYNVKTDFKLNGGFLIALTSMRAKRLAKFNFKDVSPLDVIKDNDIPVMFAHGDEDKLVPVEMSIEMYEAKKKNKKLYIAKGAGHARAIEVDREEYEKQVMEFVDDVLAGKYK
ncbi:MAG: alpha/beta hydrolase [Clostridiaceae bacterium]